MNIVSWNVNGIRSAREKGLFAWMASENPDVLCLQETKANPDMLPPEYGTVPAGNGEPYHAYWSSAKKRGYSGTAVYCRHKPKTVFNLGIPEFDDEGRLTGCDFGDIVVISAYFPNSQEAGKRLDYKLGFCSAVFDLCKRQVTAGKHVVLSGDYNIAHKPIDLANPKSNEENPGFLPQERAWMDDFTAGGFVDTFRHFCPEPKQYTWWSYRFHAREKDIGWRLDYHCVNESLVPKVRESTILKEIAGSDHCPVRIIIEP